MAEEKNFENRVKRFLKDEGIWHLKTFGNAFQRSGVPDLLICVNGYFMAVELKAEKGKPSELQRYEIKKIQESGGIGLVLKPSDFEEFKKYVRSLKNEK